MKGVFENLPGPRFAAVALTVFAMVLLGWITINGLRERYAALAELGEQRQRLTQALAMRDTGNQALLDIRRRLEPLPAEVPAQQDAMSLLRAFWAEAGHPPPLELKLERPEARLGIAGLSVLAITARARIEDEQLDAFLQPLEARRDQFRLTGLSLKPASGPALPPGQVEVILTGNLLVRRMEAAR